MSASYFHKKTIYSVTILFLCCGILLTAGAQSYSLFTPPDLSKELQQDFIYLLSQSTRENWQITTDDKKVKKGIVLKIANRPEFTTKESFHLQTDGNKILIISSASNEGLIFGFYKHLRLLGFKFYLPDELYTIIPSLAHPFGTKRIITDQPFLQIRDFFGTGGLGSGNSDPDKSVEKAWRLWKTRNGFGSAYQLAGHRGENFILENKKQLKQNPQWLVSPLTNNDHADQAIKLNYLNKNALNFYVDWTIASFTRKDYKTPPPNFTDLVSIEPSDGGGFLNNLPANAKKQLPSISDQVYGAANLAAEKLDQLFPNHPNIGVNLYAYSSHAEPPSFELHPRVFVQIIPYQYQNIAFGPSFVKLWAAKAKRFSLYDYFKYTDSQFDLPGGITLDETIKRLVHSVQNGSEGTLYETSLSKFATGIPLWVIGRYMADGNSDWQKNLDVLIQDLYPGSQQHIKELFNLFYANPSFTVNQLGNAVDLLQKATTGTKGKLIDSRLSELKQYLQFIHLVYQSRDLKNGSPDQRLLPVAQYAWQLYETRIVHSYRIMQLVSYAFLNSNQAEQKFQFYQQLHRDWFPETPKQKAAWNKIDQGVPRAETEKNFELLKGLYKTSVSPLSYNFNDVLREMPGKYKASKTIVLGGNSNARGYVGIYTEKPSTVKIKYVLTGEAPKVTISTVDKNYSAPSAITIDKTSGEMSLKLPAGETTVFMNAKAGTTYRMEIKTENGIFFFDGAPRGIMAFYKKLSDPYEAYTYDPHFYPSHMFMPKGITTVSYKAQLNTLQITSPTGTKPVTRLLQKEAGDFETREFDIKETEAGKIWKVFIPGNFNYSMLNIPNRYLLLEEK